MKSIALLIVEDEENARRTLQDYLEKRGYRVIACGSGEEGIAAFRERRFDMVLLDCRLPGIQGEEVFAALQDIQPAVPVVFMTAFAEVERAVKLLRQGAFHYLTKPFELEEMLHLVQEGVEKVRLGEEVTALRERMRELQKPDDLVFRSRAMGDAVHLAMRVADSQASVLLTGESGTGKEVLARVVHQASPRRDQPFVRVNLAALPSTLVEAELFGAEKGAFTGADRSRKGRFEEADGGTLFLDEIGDLPADIQVKLLRALQEREITRLGSNRPVSIDIRLVSATHRDLEAAIRRREFREDLFFRLNTITVAIPPLRDRREDIPPLVDHFIRRFAAREGKPVEGITPDALDLLLRHRFPGNVRELEHLVERALVLARNNRIDRRDLPSELARPGAENGTDLEALPLPERMKAIEREILQKVLSRHGQVRSRAARELGISESTLRYRMEVLGLKRQERKNGNVPE